MASRRGRVEECRLRGKDEVRECEATWDWRWHWHWHLQTLRANNQNSRVAQAIHEQTHCNYQADKFSGFWNSDSIPSLGIIKEHEAFDWARRHGMELHSCSHLQRMLYSPQTVLVQAAYQPPFQDKTVAQQTLLMPRPSSRRPALMGWWLDGYVSA